MNEALKTINTTNGNYRQQEPDPSSLTTQQLLREIFTLKELFETRLNGMDKGITLLQDKADRAPSTDVVAQVIESFKALEEEKFISIQLQFKERDVRTEQSSKDSKVAVDAALQAAKEAVGEQNKSNALAIAKSETAFTKQIDAIGLLITAAGKSSDDKIDDIKNRITTIEGSTKGKSDTWIFLIAAASVAISLIAVFLKTQ